jgi:hypothetical protein
VPGAVARLRGGAFHNVVRWHPAQQSGS